MDATSGIKQSCTHAVTSVRWVTRCWLYVGISVVTIDVTFCHFYGSTILRSRHVIGLDKVGDTSELYVCGRCCRHSKLFA